MSTQVGTRVSRLDGDIMERCEGFDQTIYSVLGTIMGEPTIERHSSVLENTEPGFD